MLLKNAVLLLEKVTYQYSQALKMKKNYLETEIDV